MLRYQQVNTNQNANTIIELTNIRNIYPAKNNNIISSDMHWN
jgi:hypothetical protein